MKDITKMYFRLFVIYGLTFGFLMSLWDYINKGEIDILKQVFMVVFFGGFMSLITIKNFKKNRRNENEGTELSYKDFKATQTNYIPNIISIENAFERLKKYDSINNWNLKLKDSKIEGKTKVSWTSWGEKISITFFEEKIEIKSKPKLKFQIIDNGNNFQNVKRLRFLLENE